MLSKIIAARRASNFAEVLLLLGFAELPLGALRAIDCDFRDVGEEEAPEPAGTMPPATFDARNGSKALDYGHPHRWHDRSATPCAASSD
jgi:hypothetical protein